MFFRFLLILFWLVLPWRRSSAWYSGKIKVFWDQNYDTTCMEIWHASPPNEYFLTILIIFFKANFHCLGEICLGDYNPSYLDKNPSCLISLTALKKNMKFIKLSLSHVFDTFLKSSYGFPRIYNIFIMLKGACQ